MAHDRVEAVERALTILDSFSEEDDGLTLAELATRTGFYKSTILRLNRSLERFGYLIRSPDGTFRLGPALWRLGSLYRREFDLGERVRPVLRRLRDATGETASFYIRDGDVRVCLYRINSNRAIRHHLDEGVHLPLDRGAAGRLLLAYSGEPGPRHDRLRSAGFAISLGERDPEIASVAVPVLTPGGKIRGALTISGLITRFDEDVQEKYVILLKTTARELEASLGGGGMVAGPSSEENPTATVIA